MNDENEKNELENNMSTEEQAASVETEVEATSRAEAIEAASGETTAEASVTEEELPQSSDAEASAEESTVSKGEPDEYAHMQWYVVNSYSGYEEKSKNALLEQARINKCEDLFGNIIIPTSVSESTTKTGKKREVTKTLFPGYMLIQMDLTDKSMMVVKNTPRISGFIGNQKAPRPLPDSEVLRYTNPEAAAAEEASRPQVAVLYEKGQGVKVTDGPFSNFDGVVDEVKPDKARLRVLVSIFGRETPVELAYDQVEKL